MSVCVCKMTQITQIHLFFLRVFVSPLSVLVRVFLSSFWSWKSHRLWLESAANSTCFWGGAVRILSVTTARTVEWEQREWSRVGNGGRGWGLENVHIKLAETASSSSSQDFDLFAHKRSPWCFHIGAVTELFTALYSCRCCSQVTVLYWIFFIEYQVGTEQIKAFHHFAHVFSETSFSRICGIQFNFIHTPQWIQFYAFFSQKLSFGRRFRVSIQSHHFSE